MKTFKTIFMLSLFTLISACSSKSNFPVSSTTPAADISAKKSVDNQNNYVLEITAENLADSERLDPSGSNYSVWIKTKEHGIRNVGQLNVSNAKKTSFKTLTPFDFDEVFITVENQGDLTYPRGVEISRTKI
ncbi:MAG: hypothetical protein ACK4RM_08430 [Flavobacterium sp.]